eukprot:GEZU01029282.1.p1 GENE.GEZU01029282.1~~GEZU01029282.1.p1  ORF type:complete len:228 (-),score=70.04 GEZU01029282.1:131-814(-)
MRVSTYLCAFALLVVLATFFAQSEAAYGIDVSSAICQSLTADDWNCLAQQGNSFAIIQIWDGGYQINQNLANCVANAWNAGFAHVDIYGFFCPNCDGNDPQNAINQIKDYVNDNGVTFGQLWIDVEQCSGCWNDADSNCNYVGNIISTAQNEGFNVGVYSSENAWSTTVGGCSAFTDLPLWYAHYDDWPSFSDGAYYFGGWSSPAMKQYSGTGNECGITVDLDWYPD